jgi:hypothetical protein
MGVVYLARDEQLGRDVAIKLLSPGALANEAARLRANSSKKPPWSEKLSASHRTLPKPQSANSAMQRGRLPSIRPDCRRGHIS